MSARTDRANEELEQLVHVVSHDLRAPIRAIDALAKWIELDLGDALTGDIASNMQLLRDRVRRVDQLLADLLEYSRAGHEKATPEPLNVQHLVDEIVAHIAPPKAMRFQVGPQPELHTSQPHLRRVLLNLMTNAVEHHDRESGEITLRTSDLGDYYEFVVSDDGPGIPARLHERAFGMCQTLKVRDATTGSGMGLAIARRIVEGAGGKLWLESGSDGHDSRGTTFFFTWPKTWPSPREGSEGES